MAFCQEKDSIFVGRFSSLPPTLSDPTEIPPYRETGVAIPLSHCVSCGIADYRCYTPTSFRKRGLSPSRKVRKKKQKKNTEGEVGHFWAIFVFFSYFRGPTRGGGFCIFLVGILAPKKNIKPPPSPQTLPLAPFPLLRILLGTPPPSLYF